MMIAVKMTSILPFMNSSRSAGTSSTSAMDRAEAQVTRAKSRGKMPLPEIKLQMQAAFNDMPGIEAERIKYKINMARSVNELWLIRSDMYQTISMLRGQTEAALRIKHWLPAQQLAAI
jgi:hypothetical protein